MSGDPEVAQRIDRLVYPTSVTSFFARALGALRPVRVDPDGGVDRLVLGDLGIKSVNGVWCFPFAEAGAVRALAVVSGGPLSGDPEALALLRELARPVARAMVRLGTWTNEQPAESEQVRSGSWATLQARARATLDPRRSGEPLCWKRRTSSGRVETDTTTRP